MRKTHFLPLFLLLLSPSQGTAYAPPKLLSVKEGCGSLECCRFGTEWEVARDASIMSSPKGGKKIGTAKKGQYLLAEDAITFATRGVLKLSADKAGAKSGEEIYFYDLADGRAFRLYSKSGKKIEAENGTDFLHSDVLRPTCADQSKCFGEIKRPSKGSTYIKVTPKKGKPGWIDFANLEAGC